MQEPKSIRVNDTVIYLKSCHCGLIPGESEAMRAIAELSSLDVTKKCCVCGKEIKPSSFVIEHQADVAGAKWIANPNYDDLEQIIVRPGRKDCLSAHKHCLPRAFPHLPEDMEAKRMRANTKAFVSLLNHSRPPIPPHASLLRGETNREVRRDSL